MLGSLACGPFSTLENLGPNLGAEYHIAKSEIQHLEGVCMSEHTWGLVNRGKRMLVADAKKLCKRETAMRWRFYDWTQCWNAHQEDGKLERCGSRPLLPGEKAMGGGDVRVH